MRLFAIKFVAAGAVLALMASGAIGADVKDSGSLEASYVKRDIHPIDQDRHVLALSNAKGTSKNPRRNVDGLM